ncbi:MAG: APC family permease [Anaerolineales bacterium]|nr:APC family permease [Anaerolineales bacterium]
MSLRYLHHLLIGSPLATSRLTEERLGNIRALAALSPDALASITYANQEIYLGLVVAGAAGLAYAWPIALAISLLLAILALSYSQTITAYPSGGGSYTVARENLGTTAGLVAAAALLIDYILNVAVSATAGIAALASAFPTLWPYRTVLALIVLAAITLANLRGLREAGAMMTAPVYVFLGVYLALIAAGLVRMAFEGAAPLAAVAPPAAQPVGLLLVLHTFSAGCTALTGIESISNGVPVFRPPETRHANQTMLAMAGLMAALFLGTIGLTQFLAVTASADQTILSALVRRVIGGDGPAYLLVQFSTLAVLMVAANTSFMGFPRVAWIMARDGFVPRQLGNLGDRLVYSNGILLLSGVAGALIVIFGGDTHALIPLFAVGAFLAFTLSQAGMVRHWWRVRGPRWMVKSALNGVGTLATLVTLAIIAASKFVDGAWIVVLLIPLLITSFRLMHGHYAHVAEELGLRGLPPSLRPLPRPRVVVPVAGVHRGVIKALRYACSISDHVTAVHIEIEAGSGEAVRRLWDEWGLDQDARLVIVRSPYRSIVAPFLTYLDDTDLAHNDGQHASVLFPEFVPAHWWQGALHNQSAWLLRMALLYRRRLFGGTRAIIDVPWYLRE